MAVRNAEVAHEAQRARNGQADNENLNVLGAFSGILLGVACESTELATEGDSGFKLVYGLGFSGLGVRVSCKIESYSR